MIVGVKVTLTVQLAPTPSIVPQVLVAIAKSAGSAPAMVMLDRFKVALPTLVTVKLLARLVVPTRCMPKLKWVGLKRTSVPVPVREMV